MALGWDTKNVPCEKHEVMYTYRICHLFQMGYFSKSICCAFEIN